MKALTSGTIIRYKDRPWIITDCAELLDLPDGWPDHYSRGAVFANIRELGVDKPRKGSVRMHRFHRLHEDGDVVVDAESEGHYPVCGDCGDVWPCRHDLTRRHAVRSAEVAAARFEHEAEHPYPCLWHARFALHDRKRCKSSGGLTLHLRRCQYNPANWDLTEWLPLFDDNLKVTGGCVPSAYGDMVHICRMFGARHDRSVDECVAIAEAVRDAAINGELPATLADLRWGAA